MKEYLCKIPVENILFDVGTCSLHIVHGSFKTGHKASSWKVNTYLRKSFHLLKDFPSRRADYARIAGTKDFPLKFCTIRWLENEPALKRGIKVLPSIRKYIDEVEKAPDSNCFLELKKILKDKFLEAKMYFTLSIAEICTPFLLRFQTDAPAFPFLYEELRSLLTLIGRKFLKKVVFHSKFEKNNLKM